MGDFKVDERSWSNRFDAAMRDGKKIEDAKRKIADEYKTIMKWPMFLFWVTIALAIWAAIIGCVVILWRYALA